ncbi:MULTISPECIES: RNA-binding S4 domain-containing protein [Desulfosediminicola]|uniref:RNA-binding S4 domain-containing protein n=1 Tax=Desulfosediminicola TaxID=2886823 RepID=UPI0010AC0B91|nr:S4 domain-containing protein [Desulfosediminicola ganghwensis]
METSSGQVPHVRIDKWLWAARFFKTRSLAAKAVNGGKVHLNNTRVKAARNVQEGDKLVISKGQDEFHIEVLAVASMRRPASEARLLYEETEESIRERENQRDMRRMMNAGHVHPTAKPDKRDRRKIKAFIRKD